MDRFYNKKRFFLALTKETIFIEREQKKRRKTNPELTLINRLLGHLFKRNELRLALRLMFFMYNVYIYKSDVTCHVSWKKKT